MASRRGTPPSDKEREQWAAERQAKLAALHERIADEVGKLTDGDQWRKWLAFAAKFHGYSFNNVMLIMSQRPDATWVAGYKRWAQVFDRQVRKREKGIAILAPISKRVSVGEPQNQAEDTKEPEEQTNPNVRVLHGFKPAYVFDISQTDGPDIDVPAGPTLADVTPQLLTGEAPQGLWDELVRVATENGYTVARGHCNGANGFTDYTARLIKVRDDVDDAQAAKTMIHELGHMLMHTPDDFGWGTTRGCRGEREVEAESVAFLVAEHYALDSSDYTFAYVTGWAQRAAVEAGQSPEDIVRAAGRRIVSTAFRITEAVDAALVPGSTDVSPAVSKRVIAGTERTAALRTAVEAGAEHRSTRPVATFDQPPAAPRLSAARAFPPLPQTLHSGSRSAFVPAPVAAVTVSTQKGPRLP
ncbi:ImmA/IrrE family metallo-endopeptidase (plasmid) [Micromonospora zamorensis]|uniref:ArdC-like ssDNA-binding domain-containing protein n=1 Tax=Micromonospora zamorensis TaxID=709883 RepID=UPI002E213CB1